MIDLIARTQEGVADEFDDLVRAAAEDHVSALEAELLGNGFPEVVTAAIRIKVGALQRLAHGRQRLGRRPERILVGSELDDLCGLQPQFTGHVFDRLAGLVRDEIAQPGMGEFPNIRHKQSRRI